MMFSIRGLLRVASTKPNLKANRRLWQLHFALVLATFFRWDSTTRTTSPTVEMRSKCDGVCREYLPAETTRVAFGHRF